MNKTSTVDFRYDIQGLRGLSILLVILSYTSYPFLSKGYIGVDIFFVISGFLITKLLVTEYESTHKIRFRNFYAKRVKRIIPAASIVLLAVVTISTILYKQEGSILIYVESLWASVFLSNYYYATSGTDYFNHETVFALQNYWSLGVEEQIYIILPFVMLLTMFMFKTRKKLAAFFALVAVASFAYSLYEISVNPSYAYFSTLSRVWQFAVGGIAAIIFPYILNKINSKFSKIFMYSGIILIFASLVIMELSPINPLYLAFLPTVATVFIIISGENNTTFYNPLNNKILIWLGFISFSLYLWYWPIYTFYTNSQLNLPIMLTMATAFLTSIILAWLTTKYVENPIRRNNILKMNPIKTIILGISTIVFTIMLPMLLILNTPAIQQVSKEEIKPTTLQELQIKISDNVKDLTPYTEETIPQLYELSQDSIQLNQYKCINKEETSSEIDSECLYGDLKSEHTLVVFGDSQAAMWVPALDLIGQQSDFKVMLLAKTGCPPINKTTYSNVLMRPSQECETFKQKAMEIIKTDPTVETVLLTGLTTDKYIIDENQQPIKNNEKNLKEWEAGYSSIIQELKSYKVKPIMITSTPELTISPKTCISANIDNVKPCETTIASKQATIEMEKKVATGNDINYIETEKLFCYQEKCPVIIDNHIVYQDQFHIAGTYMEYILYPFTELLYDATIDTASNNESK